MCEMSREEAIECIEAIHVQMFNGGNSKWTKACDMAIEALKEQRPHGEWVESKERKGHFYCSECVQKDPETGKWRETFDFKYPFCPNCGADMRKER